MKQDRIAICNIISELLDHPDENDIYPTSKCYADLEKYIEGVRMETLGWSFSYFCDFLDNNQDPRVLELTEIIEDAKQQLEEK